MCVRDQMFDQREAISLLVKIHIAQTLQTDLPIVSLLVETPSHLAQTPLRSANVSEKAWKHL
jgi:hypothetical protein